MNTIFAEGWIWWAAALAIGVPVILVVLTELLGALTRRGNPAAGPVRLLRNWVVPVGALFALLTFAVQSPAEQVWVRVVATVLGFLVILLVLSSFNVALFSNARSGSWRERIPTIFIEIARLILVIVGLALLFQWCGTRMSADSSRPSASLRSSSAWPCRTPSAASSPGSCCSSSSRSASVTG